MTFAARAKHPSEGDLLRLIDGDGAADELAGLRAHTAACGRCEKALGSLDRDARAVRARLAEIPVSPAGAGAETHRAAGGGAAPAAVDPGGWPARGILLLRERRLERAPGAPRPWLRAAVALLALAGTFALVPPLRARIADWLAGGPPEARPAPQPAGAVPARAAAPAPSNVLWFTPAAREIRVVVSARQLEGTLDIIGAAAQAASLTIAPPDPAVAPLLSERVLEIRNVPAARSSYVLRLPPGVRSVVVTVAGGPARVVSAAQLAAGVRIAVGR